MEFGGVSGDLVEGCLAEPGEGVGGGESELAEESDGLGGWGEGGSGGGGFGVG